MLARLKKAVRIELWLMLHIIHLIYFYTQIYLKKIQFATLNALVSILRLKHWDNAKKNKKTMIKIIFL